MKPGTPRSPAAVKVVLLGSGELGKEVVTELQRLGRSRMKKPCAATAGGVRLAVRLTPRASRNGIDGIVTGADGRTALQIRLTAPPVDGAANDALIAFLAKTLDLRKSDISIVSGQTSRLKILQLSGDSATILKNLNA